MFISFKQFSIRVSQNENKFKPSRVTVSMRPLMRLESIGATRLIQSFLIRLLIKQMSDNLVFCLDFLSKKVNDIPIMSLYHILANKSPHFPVATTLYAYKGQMWSYKVPAIDPESRPMKYNFVGETYGMHLSSSGVITWIPTELKNYNFTINVEDPCGLNASKQFFIKVMACSCENYNGAKCARINHAHPNNGSYCVCPTGCKGET